MVEFLFKGIGEALTHVPLMIWVVIFVGIIIFGVLMRYLTNIKVDLFIAVVFVIVNSIFVWRAYWIKQGYTEAQAQVEAYKKTNALIIACYDKDPAAHIWDRSQGKCLRRDGAVE